MKLFKTACLAYQPSQVVYRDNLLDRGDLINIRRNLVDQLTELLPKCDIFKEKAFYPKRYFDDLMIEDKGFLEQMQGVKSMAELKTL